MTRSIFSILLILSILTANLAAGDFFGENVPPLEPTYGDNGYGANGYGHNGYGANGYGANNITPAPTYTPTPSYTPTPTYVPTGSYTMNAQITGVRITRARLVSLGTAARVFYIEGVVEGMAERDRTYKTQINVFVNGAGTPARMDGTFAISIPIFPKTGKVNVVAYQHELNLRVFREYPVKGLQKINEKKSRW